MSPRFLYKGSEYDEPLNTIRPDIARDLTFLDPTYGHALPEPAQSMMRAKLERRSGGIRELQRAAADGTPAPVDFIPELWPWGTNPMLGGNPKAGKTTFVADLTAALWVPGYRFLGHFEPADLGVDPRYERLRVVVINAETSQAAFEREIGSRINEWAETQPGYPWPEVYNLPLLGGPRLADVTDPGAYDALRDLLTTCPDDDCDGTNFEGPSVILLDGLTAILAAAGKGVEHYGLWYAAWRQLLREIDTPTSLVTAHNTLQGGHLMGGVEAQAGADGNWRYSKSDSGRRTFAVEPRLGGTVIEETPVRMENRRLLLTPKRASTGSSPSPVASVSSLPDAVLAVWANDREWRSGNQVSGLVTGRQTDVSSTLAALSSPGGPLERRNRQGNGGGFEYRPATTDPDPRP